MNQQARESASVRVPSQVALLPETHSTRSPATDLTTQFFGALFAQEYKQHALFDSSGETSHAKAVIEEFGIASRLFPVAVFGSVCLNYLGAAFSTHQDLLATSGTLMFIGAVANLGYSLSTLGKLPALQQRQADFTAKTWTDEITVPTIMHELLSVGFGVIAFASTVGRPITDGWSFGFAFCATAATVMLASFTKATVSRLTGIAVRTPHFGGVDESMRSLD